VRTDRQRRVLRPTGVNPSNLLVLANSPMALGLFIQRLLLPSSVAIGLTLLGVALCFRHDLEGLFEVPSRCEGISFDRRVVLSLGGVGGLAVCCVLGSAFGWPLGIVAVAGGVALVVLDATSSPFDPRALAADMPWAYFLCSAAWCW
jgi:Na+/H+ antiporter NhaD/arsenite permease-like protein